MCEIPKDRMTAKDAAERLARLMERQLGYADGHIDSVALRLFIRAYWSRVDYERGYPAQDELVPF